MPNISEFLERHFRHFNARETLAAARAWRELLDGGGQMLLALGGAMSTAELGLSLAEMIRQDKVHAVSCTGANLEEDLFNLFAHREYRMVPNWRQLSPADELALREQHLNRVTDTCIPEDVMRYAEQALLEMWKGAADKDEPMLPYEFAYRLLDDPAMSRHFQVPPEDSWVIAAKEKNLPIFTPGWEDSTLGNVFCADVMRGKISSHRAVRTGTEQMQRLAEWYEQRIADKVPLGFFQIGGGIAGDFAICVVPMLILDLHKEDAPHWAYFAQITDSVTSYGGYSGAAATEKITWHKLGVEAPKFVINSDASIVAPLIFAYVLGW